MEIVQFEDKNLAHYSYLIMSQGEIALVDPARDPKPYLDFASKHGAVIKAVIETHPHADFVSSHLEIAKSTSAAIYVSKLLGAEYPHVSFDDGDTLPLGDGLLKCIFTPGHSPDSISVLAIDHLGKPKAVFTGDSLFIGDCGRPDLRESAGNTTALRADLAKQMYHTLRDKFMVMDNDVLVYPAHGAGSLCGKGLSTNNSSTIGIEKMTNWSMQSMTESEFVKELLQDQPFIPKYFTFDVGINKAGANDFRPSIDQIPRLNGLPADWNPEILVIDTRPQLEFKKKHLKNAFNLMNDTKFETWLGSIVNPGEKFYLIAENNAELELLIQRIAKIGYEGQLVAGIVASDGNESMEVFDSADLWEQMSAYTIVDIRNPSEVKSKEIFPGAIPIPLYQLRERAGELPMEKTILVHCAGGYRSAAGSSILQSIFQGKVKIYDLSVAVKDFQSKI